MAGMRGKVVRVENVTPSAGNVHFKDTVLNITSPGKEKDQVHKEIIYYK